MQLLRPRGIVGIGKRRDTALARVVDKHVDGAEGLLHGVGKGCHLRGVEHVARCGKQRRVREAVAQTLFG